MKKKKISLKPKAAAAYRRERRKPKYRKRHQWRILAAKKLNNRHAALLAPACAPRCAAGATSITKMTLDAR